MPSVGEKLRQARIEQGLSVKDISARTKISSRFLEAIESDDRQRLPAGFFYRNWVHQYAETLSLDVAAITAEVDQIVAGDAPPSLPGQHNSISANVRPAPLTYTSGGNRNAYSIASLLIVVVGCSGFYVWWRSLQVHANAVQESRPIAAAAVKVETPAALEPVEPMGTNVPLATAPVKPAVATPAPPADGLHVEVAATQPVWISIAPDGKQIFADTLQPAQVRTIEALSSVRIRLGNAGGADVRVNGKSIGPVGPNGQIRTVVIDKSGFHVFEPKPVVVKPSDESAPIPPALNQ